MDGRLENRLALADFALPRGGAYSGHVDILGKPVRIDISAAALRALTRNRHPIMVEMELYFSCLIRKQVYFSELTEPQQEYRDSSRILPGLYATFRAVTTSHCRIEDPSAKPPVEAMPIREPHRFVPDWLTIDHRRRGWQGEYGFSRYL